MRYHTKNLVFLIALIAVLILSTPRHSAAQERCDVIPEAIERLNAPRLGTYTLWDLAEGEVGAKTTYQDFIPVNEREVILLGSEVQGYKTRPYLKQINRKGRVLWQWTYAGTDPLILKDVVEDGDKFWAVGQISKNERPHGIWIGKFTRGGTLLEDSVLSEPSKNLHYGAVIPAENGGWLVAATESRVTQEPTLENSYARFILLDGDFKRLFSRSFMPGPGNHVNHVHNIKGLGGQSFYIVVGEIEDRAGRTAGLIMRLDDKGNIVWQRTYPRGENARFLKSTSYEDNSLLVIGEVQPITPEAPNAGLAMRIDSSNGTELWQRYYMRDDMAYRAEDMLVEQSGRAHILLSGIVGGDSKFQNHARLITVSPRGQILKEIAYTAGQNARPFKLKDGLNGLFMISGDVIIEEPDPENPKGDRITSQKGWFIVGEGAPPYEDPCRIIERTF